MNKSLNIKSVSKIKKLLSKGYKESMIKTILEKEYNNTIAKSTIVSIKLLESYEDIEPQLNDSIVRQINSKLTDYEKNLIEEVKFTIASGFSEEEILKNFPISKSKYDHIRYSIGISRLIATEYNDALLKIKRKKIRITPQMVSQVKELYSSKNGNIPLSEISNKVGIDKSHISRIVNLKVHQNYGQNHNASLRKILKQKIKLQKQKNLNREKKLKMQKDLELLCLEKNQVAKSISDLRQKINQI